MNLNLEIDSDIEKYLIVKEPMFGGIHYEFRFKNGYGASVIKHNCSYGRYSDEWEVACLYNGVLCYPKLMDGDVIGYLKDNQVNKLLRLIRDKKLDVSFEDVQENEQ